MKQLIKKFSVVLVMAIMVFVGVLFTGCDDKAVGIKSIEKTGTVGNVDVYTITYTDNTTSQFTVTNGKDADKLTIDEIYAKYLAENPGTSYADFLREYLTINKSDNSEIINDCLSSCVKVYSEYKVTQTISSFWTTKTTKGISISCGSAVLYKVEGDYTYAITNYHVIFNANANEDNGSKFASKITCYLYGSDGEPMETDSTLNGYTVYDYGDNGIQFTYVGGAIDKDIAIIKAKTADIQKVNPNFKTVTFADSYSVGETAIAIGNPEAQGISVTEGIISVDNEYVALNIDGTARYYRSIRMDTAIYGGSSGGGLFNSDGKLIGITNAGNTSDQNINYSIPVQIVKNTAENIMAYYDGESPATIKKVTLGFTVKIEQSQYVYDSESGLNRVKEVIKVVEITEDSIIEELGVQVDDIITGIVINDKTYNINRNFEIQDLILTMRSGDKIKIIYTRENSPATSTEHTILESEVK